MNVVDRVFVALDGLDKKAACALVNKLVASPVPGSLAGFKIHDLWDRHGPDVVMELLESAGGVPPIWVDAKLHDVPRTVSLRAQAIAQSGARFVTVHASGGIRMMADAVDATNGNLRIIAITVLTSLLEEETHLLCGQPAKAAVLLRAQWAKLAGAWGVVCSALEVGILAKQPELSGLALIVPGIRLAGAGATDDNQKRVDTPAAAFRNGADFIVVGSEITKAEDPVGVLSAIVEEISAVPEKK